MFNRLKVQDRGASHQQGGPSLLWMLFLSVVLVLAAMFIVVQLFDPNMVAISPVQRLDLDRLGREASDNLPWILTLGAMMMAGVLAALHLGLRPLRQISERAGDIGPATISQRLPLGSTPREIAPLVLAFNATLDRLETGWRAQREFSANAAHELRTPLATLRAQVESLLDPDQRKDAIEEFDRLSRLISQLLTLAEADSSQDPGLVIFDLVSLARALATDMAGPILAGGRSVAFDSAHEHWDRQGSPGLVEVALRNLIENAMRHTPPGAEILVSIDSLGRLMVSDNGMGVPPSFQDRLFDRFSKADARGLGAGLGLSIVHRIMVLHGGQVRLDPLFLGARFVLDFSGQGPATRSDPHGSRLAWPRPSRSPARSPVRAHEEPRP